MWEEGQHEGQGTGRDVWDNSGLYVVLVGVRQRSKKSLKIRTERGEERGPETKSRDKLCR